MRVIAVAVGLICALSFYLVSVTLNAHPEPTAFGGWIELVREGDGLPESGHQVLLQAHSGYSGLEAELLTYSVVVCARDGEPFEGLLLIGGDARLRDLRATGPTESIPAVRDIPSVALGWPGAPVALGAVQAVEINIDRPSPCWAETLEDSSAGFGGSPVEVSGRPEASVMRPTTVGWWSGPRSGMTWPLVGAIPGLPSSAAGVFEAVEGLSGSWLRVTARRNVVTGPVLEGRSHIEVARPGLSEVDTLAWESSRPVAPTVRIVDFEILDKWQHWQVVASIALGIGGSLVAGVFLNDRRMRPTPLRAFSDEGTAIGETLQWQRDGGATPVHGRREDHVVRVLALAFLLAVLRRLHASWRRRRG